eukprot:GHVU01113725.1.p1 GENE.GHVU01113725.1~~GHVU01113725.1.p1  ORF type:complete len:191 (+),score=18.06 GHVU01113725.1:382-954(+)
MGGGRVRQRVRKSESGNESGNELAGTDARLAVRTAIPPLLASLMAASSMYGRACVCGRADGSWMRRGNVGVHAAARTDVRVCCAGVGRVTPIGMGGRKEGRKEWRDEGRKEGRKKGRYERRKKGKEGTEGRSVVVGRAVGTLALSGARIHSLTHSQQRTYIHTGGCAYHPTGRRSSGHLRPPTRAAPPLA